MNSVRTAIAEVLENDAQLALLAPAGVHWSIAPQGIEPPYVIFQKQAGTRTYTFGGPPMLNEVYLVKGVGDPFQAEAINERCLTLLDGVVLVVNDRELLLRPMPEDDVDYVEVDSGEAYQHVGINYRVVTEAS